MNIRRNDPCPCGSGRKYKVCCLKKQDIMEFRQLQADRFFDSKHSLTVKMLEFLHTYVPSQERSAANRLFKEVHKLPSSSKLVDYYSKFWLCYFYTFRNGLRGVEWFSQKGKLFSPSEQALLATWVQMKPRLLQVTGEETDGITVTDLITKETFFLPYCETLKQVWPWGVALAMLEPFGEHHCIHGISSFESPIFANKLADMILEKMQETGESYPAVMQQHFLQLVQCTFSQPEEQTVTEEETTLVYQVFDFKQAVLFLQDHKAGLYSDHFEKENKKAQFSWTGPWYQYTDSSFPGIIQASEVHASIDLSDQRLTFKTKDPEIVKEFMSNADRFPSVLKLMEQSKETISISKDMSLRTTNLRLEREDTPPWFTLYAQKLMHMKLGVNKPRLTEQSGENKTLEAWLREAEYRMMKLMRGQFPTNDQPFDPNPLRRELGLPRSPFVSKDRHCSIVQVEVVAPQIEVIPDDDVPYYQQFGLTPETAFSFYASDLVQFFKFKTTGKSSSTLKKYQWGIEKLVHYFLSLNREQPEDWNQCDRPFWENLIAGFYVLDSYQGSMSQAQAFLSVMKQLAAWLDQKYAAEHGALVREILKESEEELLAAVAANRASINLTPDKMMYQQVHEGYLEVLSVHANEVALRPLHHDNVFLVGWLDADNLRTGMLVHGILGEKGANKAVIIEIKAIYPSCARHFLGCSEELVLVK